MIKFYFACEGMQEGQQSYMEQEYNHYSEEQARRELIHVLNEIMGFYPRKITLIRQEKAEDNIWSQLD